MTALQEIAELKSKLALAEAATVAARNESAELVAVRETASNLALENSTLKTELAAEKLAKESAVAEKAAAEKALAEKSASIDATIAANVIEQTAALGAPAVKLDARQTAAKEMKMSEFNKLSHSDRNAFMRSGGKLTD